MDMYFLGVFSSRNEEEKIIIIIIKSNQIKSHKIKSNKMFYKENSSLGCRVRVVQMCRDRESGILVILLMVDHRVVDILGVDVILDMDELTAIGLLIIGTLAGLSYPTRSWSWAR